MRVVGVLGIALDGDLRARSARDGLEDAAEEVGIEAGRGAPAEEDAGGRGEAAVARRPVDLGDAGRA